MDWETFLRVMIEDEKAAINKSAWLWSRLSRRRSGRLSNS